MQRFIPFILAVLLMLSFSGCGRAEVGQEPAPPITQIGNPWSSHSSIQDAEAATEFLLGLPNVIADQYAVDQIRTMNNALIEVIYRYEEFEVCVRKQPGEGQDISGDYSTYETCTETTYNGGTITRYHNSDTPATKQIISHEGYSWSLVAPNGFSGDSGEDFWHEICK